MQKQEYLYFLNLIFTMSIAVCMIVKSEEKWLEQCLNSVKNLADEIIIVDTGSKDNTREIAKKFTDKIFDLPWNNDFSDARNFSISKANSDWILCLDADESISQIDFEKIREMTKNPEANAYHFIWRDYTNDIGIIGWKSTKEDIYPESKVANGYSENYILRLFQNLGYEFEGKIHETIQNSIKRKNGKIFLSDAVIHHYGNLRNKDELLRKKETYSDMLNERLISKDNKEKEEYYILFELARELMIKKEIEEAKKALEDSIRLNPEFSKTLAMLGAIKIIEKNFNEAEKLLKKAVILEPDDSDIHSNLGVIYSEQENYSKAVRKFERAIELNPKSADNFFNLGLVYLRMKKKDRARYFLEKAAELNPVYKEKIGLLNLS